MALKLGSLFYDIGANTSGLKKAEKEVSRTNKRMEKSFGGVGSAIKAALTFEAARRVLLLADNMRLLDARIKEATRSQREFLKSQKELLAISNRTGQALASTVSLFQSLKIAAGDIGATNDQTLELTETLQQLGIIGGSSVTQMSNAMMQFGQAMAGGVVRAEEFNSIVENTPLVAKAIATGLGMSVGQLRKMVIEGKVLSKDVFNALQGQTADIQERFEKIPVTMERAWQGFLNNAGQVTKELNNQLGITDFIAERLKAAGQAMGKMRESLKLSEQREEREAAINKLLESRGLGDFFSKDLNNAKTMAAALEKREVLEAKLKEAEESKSIFAAERITNTKRELEAQNKTIANLDVEKSKAANVKQTWDQMTASINKARAAEAGDDVAEAAPVAPTAAPGKGPEGLSFQQILARLGDERAAVREEFAKARADIITSEKITDEQRLELLKAAGDQRLQAMKELADEEVEIVTKSEEEKAQIQRTKNAVALRSAAAFTSSLTDVIRAGGAEQTAAGKAIFMAQQGIAVASIIASTLEASGKAGAAVAGAGPAAWFASKTGIETMGFANAGIVAGLSVSNITGGGRQSGGPVSPGRVHPINENGDPEVLVQGARQFLLPGSKGGDVVSGANMRMSGGGAPSVTINNSGAPIEIVEQRITRDEVVLMVRNAENSAVGRVDSSLSSGRGSTSRALKTGFETQRNLT